MCIGKVGVRGGWYRKVEVGSVKWVGEAGLGKQKVRKCIWIRSVGVKGRGDRKCESIFGNRVGMPGLGKQKV